MFKFAYYFEKTALSPDTVLKAVEKRKNILNILEEYKNVDYLGHIHKALKKRTDSQLENIFYKTLRNNRTKEAKDVLENIWLYSSPNSGARNASRAVEQLNLIKGVNNAASGHPVMNLSQVANLIQKL